MTEQHILASFGQWQTLAVNRHLVSIIVRVLHGRC